MLFCSLDNNSLAGFRFCRTVSRPGLICLALFLPSIAYAQQVEFIQQGKTLYIIGTPASDDVQLGYHAATDQFYFVAETFEYHTGEDTHWFPGHSISRIRFFGNEGDDFFSFLGDASPKDHYRHFHVPMELFGGPGEDTLNGGSKSDLIVGGSGDDKVLRGNHGDDVIFGGAGKDDLYGEEGDDLLCGGLGGDGLFGGNGYDKIFTEGDNSQVVETGAQGGEIVPGLCLLNPRWIAGDWDGDGTCDLGWFSNDRAFFVLPGAPKPYFSFGLPGDRPVTGDWDGDGRDQAGVFRDILWFGIWQPDEGEAGYGNGGPLELASGSFGLAGDKPVAGRWRGPHQLGPADSIGTFRNGLVQLDSGDGYWSPNAWANEVTGFPFGLSGDIPFAADWDSDDDDEIAVFRPSTGTWQLDEGPLGWKAPHTHYELNPINFGSPGDIPMVGDFLGNGAPDLAVIRGNSLLIDVGSRGWHLHEPQMLETPGAMLLD